MKSMKYSQSHRNSGFLKSCSSHENFRVNSPKLVQQKKILTKPKFQIPLKSKQNQYKKNNNGHLEEQVRIQRVKSLNSSNMILIDNQNESVLQFYERQNKNLTKHNHFLLNEIRKRKQTQTSLLNYINHLKEQISNLKNYQPVEKQIIAERTCTQTIGSIQNIYPTFYKDQDKQEAKIQNLNIRFSKLMEECSQEKGKKQKINKRQKIAALAEKMKNLRKSHDYYQ